MNTLKCLFSALIVPVLLISALSTKVVDLKQVSRAPAVMYNFTK